MDGPPQPQSDHLNLHNSPHPIHHESTNHVTFQRVHYAYDLVLPVSLFGFTLLGIVFVLIVLVLWWRNSAPWTFKDDQKMDKLRRGDSPKIVAVERERNDVKYVNEKERIKPVVITTRNYGGSSPKVPEEQRENEEKFVFPPSDQPSTSRQTQPERIQPDRSQPDKSQQLKPFPVPFYRTAVPRQLAEDANRELAELTVQDRTKKFSATRSPSLEKDDKSPFVSAACDNSDVFTFEPNRHKRMSSEKNSPVVEVRIQPDSEQIHTFDANFNNNVTPVSPKPQELRRIPEHVRTSSLDVENENKERTNLRRFRSVNTRLNICSTSDLSSDIQQEKLEMQNSPRILECGSKFNFSPRLLAENNSPKFFTPTDNFSPRFFPEGSPKSVYYDSVRSPKFFPDTPKSPPIPEEKCSLSPKAFTETNNRNSPRNSPKLFVLEQHSPRILGRPRSPKVYSGNKENYFNFDGSDRNEEVDNASKKRHFQRYGGRKSIERERVSTEERHDIRRYRRHNSCDTYNHNIDNGNTITDKPEPIKFDIVGNIERISCTQNNIPKNPDQQNISHSKSHDPSEGNLIRFGGSDTRVTSQISDPIQGVDVTDCCMRTEAMTLSPKIDSPSSTNKNKEHLQTAQQRRQRLKSISLDSDNAKIIEQNLGLPIAKHIKQDNLNQALQDFSSSCSNVKRSGTKQTKFTFDCMETSEKECVEEAKYSPDFQKKSLKDSNDTKSFIDMPRFSPKEFDITITVEEDETAPRRKGNKNLRNLTIDLTRRDSDLEKELLEFEKLYTNSEEKKVKTPTLKIKAISLDSSESVNLSLPQKNTLELPQNSVSVPNTPKRQYKRILQQKNLTKLDISGGKMGYNSLHVDHRRFMKVHEGMFLKENHANLMLYQPSSSRVNRMGSFDENMADFAESPPAISVNECDNYLGSSLFKPNLSVSSTNLKTLPEGIPSTDFAPSIDDKITKKLNRRGSNQSLKLGFDQCQKHSTYSLQSSNNSLSSSGLSTLNLASIRNSASNFSLNTENRQKVLERRNSNTCLSLTDHLAPITRVIGSSNTNLQASYSNLTESQPAKNCLLQRRGSNNSLTLNIQSSNTNLCRFSSNSSLTINKDGKTCQKKGLLERRSSNTSLTLNINTSNSQLTTCKGLSISNYNLEGSTCNLSLHNSNQSITEPKKGILERRSSNTSLTINIQPDVPRDIEVDEKALQSNLKNAQFVPQRDKHKKSLSTENLLPKSYKTRNPSKDSQFGSHDDLWSNSFVSENYPQNLTYVCGDPDNEIIYAFGRTENLEGESVRNITTKPLSPQTTSEDFKTYLANIQHLQNASSVLTRKQLRDLNNVFQNGYSNVKCDGTDNNGHRCSPRDPANPHITFPETELPCSEYQKTLLRNLHQEFWDLPSNFQEKPMVFGSHTKNRYKTILPNEHSRFILKSDADAGEGYVNANFIKGHEYAKNCYIATQGPLQNTIYDFWLMVYQNSSPTFEEAQGARSKAKFDTRKADTVDLPRVQKIVMLTNFVENNRQKCEKYFPLNYEEELTFDNPEQVTFDTKDDESPRNSFVIKNTGVLRKSGYTIRKLDVRYNQAAPSSKEMYKIEETSVYHYWFHNWADHKCPKDVNSLLNLSLDVLNSTEYDFSESAQAIRDSSSPTEPTTKFVFPPLQETIDSCSSLHKPFSPIDFDDETSPPTIVHCSAGIGRTGCLIAILNGIKQLSFDQKVDILGIVCNMRLNRGGMVQNSEQYELIHKVLCLYEQLYLPNE